jgi:hypothetical protein
VSPAGRPGFLGATNLPITISDERKVKLTTQISPIMVAVMVKIMICKGGIVKFICVSLAFGL